MVTNYISTQEVLITKLSQRRLHKAIDEAPAVKKKASLFSDPWFVALFEDPGFEIDA
jgi:hypothetical protein